MRPLNATHVDQQGNYWSIPRADLSDGTGELWTGHKWITSEISDAFVQTLTRLQPLLSERISDTNAAPWVIEEIKKLENRIQELEAQSNMKEVAYVQ